jgi:RNA polymerase sigma-70 factor (ECF subfamily)
MTDEADRLYERLLVLRCQVEDEGAFAELVERYQARLRYYVGKMLCGLCEPDDVLQDVWLDVFRALPRLNEAGAFRGWLYKIARARAIKEYRKRRLFFEPIDESDVIDVESGAEDFAAEEAQKVHAAIHTLPAVQRDVLLLRYIDDLNYDEIARVIGCQLGTVRSRLHYAKLALRAEIEKDRCDER